MAQPVVIFDSVWKKFRGGERHDSLRDLVPALLKHSWSRTRTELGSEEFWAIRDVSFTVAPGEALGIVGTNGAGKSTTLKLLTRLMKPTRGHCAVRGRVGALIEVASSFHPELTGRENVYLQGAIMGMKRAEIGRKFDQIVEFADVGPFIDMPVKRYSSGMNARLGFSIAGHLEPDVLIIDEVLSVGDMAFQERCVQRMLEFKRRGAAIVFVSHNLPAVTALCDSVIVLARGESRFAGSSEHALEHFVRTIHNDESSRHRGATFEEVRIVDVAGRPVSSCGSRARLRLIARLRFLEPARNICFGIGVHQTASNLCVYSTSSRALGVTPLAAQAGESVDVSFDFDANLTRGQYLLELYAENGLTDTFIARSFPAAFLHVEERATLTGVADLAARCSVEPAAQQIAVNE